MSILSRRALLSAALAAAGLGATPPAPAQQPDTLSLSLRDAVALALRSSDEARLAAAQVDVASAQRTVARSAALPQLRLSGSYQHVYASARGQAVGALFNQPNTYNFNANLSQTFFQGGREFSALRSASRFEQAARLTADEARAQLSLDVQRAYLQALFANRALEIRTTGLVLATQRAGQVEQFASAGRAARYDVLRARVERANLEPLVIQAQSERDLALLDLKRLLNIPAERALALTTSLDAQSVQPLLASLDGDSTAVPAERPSLRAAELIARARRDAIAVARADLLPTLSAFVQVGYQAFPLANVFPTQRGRAEVSDCPPGSTPGRVCTTQNGGYFQDKLLGVNVSWPLFDGLRAKGNIDLARAQARLAEAQLAQEREAVTIEAEQARAELRRARATFTARQQNAREAEEAFRLASLRFTRGMSTQLEVSDAQLALSTAQTDEARATYDLHLAAAALARARGRPIPLPPEGAPTRTTMSPTSGARPER